MKHLIRISIVLCGAAASALFSFSCSDKAFFNESEHAWCYPHAFVSDKNTGIFSLADSAQLKKNIRVSVGLPVRFFGFISNPRPMLQLQGRWSFGDNTVAVDTIDTSFVINHVFAQPGLYPASFSLSDQAGNVLYDSVKITVTAPLKQ